MNKSIPSLLIGSGFLLAASAAQAHTGAGSTHGFFHGAGHPFGGLDHLLAMVAVGLWAAQLGGRALWAVPLTFVGIMALGGVLGMTGISLPFVEIGILASVLALGVFVAAAVRLPLTWSMALVGFLALFHGHAHGAEMPVDSSGVAYAAGFILATAALHTSGIAIGVLFKNLSTPILTRAAGACVALLGVWLVVS